MSDLVERLRINLGEIFGPTMQEAADEIERLQRENEELRGLLASAFEKLKVECGGVREYKGGMPTQVLFPAIETALKASTEQPVGVIMNNTFLPTMSMDDLRPGNVYYTPPTATALVEDFKRRVIDVVNYESESGTSLVSIIESLPLIKGEKE